LYTTPINRIHFAHTVPLCAMRSVFAALSVYGAFSHAPNALSTCNDADTSSLLQAKSLVRIHRTDMTKADSLLDSMRNVARSFAEGSDVTMTPVDVNAAIGTANTALQTMLPMLTEQNDLAQREIGHAFAAIHACHTQHGGDVRDRLQQAVTRVFGAKRECEDSLEEAIEAEHDACEGQGENPNCLCNEARTAITDQTALCVAQTETYEAVFCEHHVSCTMFHECHAQETEVYNALRVDVEAGMNSRQQEYRTYMQVDCLMNLITSAMLSGTPIDNARLVACDDVNVDHLSINFPQLLAAPADCPGPQSGNPQCGGACSPWELVLQYGEEAYPMTANAVGELDEAVNGFAKLSDGAINAIPSGGDAGFDYYMLTSDPPDNGASDSTIAWDTMFLRTSNVGGYNDMDNNMGIVSGGASWGVCNAASLDECTSWSTQTHNRFDTSQVTGNNCNRWFTGYNGAKCYAYGSERHNMNNRCFSRGHGCTDGSHRLRANVKVYKLRAGCDVAPPEPDCLCEARNHLHHLGHPYQTITAMDEWVGARRGMSALTVTKISGNGNCIARVATGAGGSGAVDYVYQEGAHPYPLPTGNDNVGSIMLNCVANED